MRTLITYAPSHLTTNPKLRHALVLDWRKVPRILAGEYPKPLPPRKWFTNDQADQDWIRGACTAAFWVVDTEYVMVKAGHSLPPYPHWWLLPRSPVHSPVLVGY